MEALADFGTVDLLGVQALTSAIYRVWNGAFDEAAALQLATVLVGLALTLLVVERVLRGRARYHQALGRGDAIDPAAAARLAGLAGRRSRCAVLLLVVFVLPGRPARRLVGGDHRRRRASTPASATPSLSTLLVASLAAARRRGDRRRSSPTACAPESTRLGRASARLATIGYAIPGTVVAVAVYVPLVWVDRHLVDAADDAFGWRHRAAVHRDRARAGARLPRPLPRPVVPRRSSRG